MKLKKILKLKNVLISLAILILIWQFLFLTSSFDSALFPSPFMAIKALGEMFQNGTLFRISARACTDFSSDIPVRLSLR